MLGLGLCGVHVNSSINKVKMQRTTLSYENKICIYIHLFIYLFGIYFVYCLNYLTREMTTTPKLV
jgi:hypothetical protein